MKKILFIVLVLFCEFSIQASIKPDAKVFLSFDAGLAQNVDGEDALKMLSSYINNQSNIEIVEKESDAQFKLILAIDKGSMGNRKAQIKVVDLSSNDIILTTKWKKGTSNAMYGYSGTRHAIGRVFKSEFLKAYPDIEKR